MAEKIFTDEQLKFLASRFQLVHEKMGEVFMTISQYDGIPLYEIDKQVGISEYIRNKCIAALELVGLVEMRGISTAKLYSLTAEGKRLKHLLEEQ